MPVPSSVNITIGGIDRTNDIHYKDARFDAAARAGVGTFSATVRDRSRSITIGTGDEVVLTLDGKKYFAGWVMQHGRTFAFPAVDTWDLSQVTQRQHAIRGVDYNILFDRLVTRDPTNYYSSENLIKPAGSQAGDLVRDFWANFVDKPAGFDTSTYVDDVGVADPQGEFVWQQQGTVVRSQMEWVSLKNAAVYYFDANKKLHYHSPQSSFARWGFSDRPNNRTVPSAATTFTGATYGFRELDAQEDLGSVINDIFVWGGSEWAGEGEVVFARSTNPTSIANHGRWQKAEVMFGDERAAEQAQVDAIANAIVQGPGDPYVSPGTDSSGLQTNRSVPAWTLRLSWYAHDVPSLDGSGAKDHLTPGDIVTTVLWVHGNGPTNPLILTLPLRNVSISFPTLPTDGGDQTFVRFDGTFGIALDDPVDLWRAILKSRTSIRRTVITTASPTTPGGAGAVYQGAPLQSPNGTRTVFTFQSNGVTVRYIAGTSEVYLNGLRLRQGADYSEQPSAGTITLFEAPATGSTLWAYLRLGT